VSAEEKYLAMQGAYYRAGWTCIKRDVLDLIVPTTFFGAPVIGGVHQEMAAVLAAIELDVRAKRPGLAQQRSAAGFIIGGFVPRLQAGSGVLSNHAFGLAIDIDPDWNPQFKKPEVRKAFARATGYDIGQALYPASSMKEVRTVYERVQKMSDHLKTWLTEWLPKYKEWREQRGAAARERDGKKKVQALDDERKNNLDLNAVAVLVDEYRLEVVEAWLVYGIVTIPPEIIESFLKIGRNNGARWGGQYDNTKDIMHLELLKLVSPDSMARAGRPGRRAPVSGFADLIRGTPPMTPNCARPATPQPRRSAPARPRRR
jgi:hypothetical protein